MNFAVMAFAPPKVLAAREYFKVKSGQVGSERPTDFS